MLGGLVCGFDPSVKVPFMKNTPRPAPTIPFNRPSVVGEELRNISEAIERGQLAGNGHFTRLCNALIAKETGAVQALLTHSCTAALEMSAILCDLGPGDEVIMPSFTFVSTANAVVLRGAQPVFVDIDPYTLNLDPAAVQRAVTDKTAAIFVVHYAGFPAEMDAISAIAAEFDLNVVEDAAQAYGAQYKGRPAGRLGDLATYSFHETKGIISGEGGALVINRPEMVKRAEIIWEKGTNRSEFIRGSVDKYTWQDVGSSMLPGELIAAYLYGQLKRGDHINHTRRKMFRRYFEAFAGLEAEGRLRRPFWHDHVEGNGHMFYLLLRDDQDRAEFIEHMKSHGIVTPFHYQPLHTSVAGQKHARSDGALAVTVDVAARLVRLPMYYGLESDIDRVIACAMAYFQNAPEGPVSQI